jgi:Ca-activated chloride channel homolog
MPRHSSVLFISAFLLVAIPLAAQFSKLNDDPPMLRQKTQVVTLNVSVIDRENRPITGLKREEFVVYEDKIQQQIEYFSAVDVPISIGIIFDASASMEAKMSKARDSLKTFMQTSHPDDDYFLVAFNREARLIADFADGEEVLSKMAALKADGETALYDAVYLGLEKLKAARHQKRALLVISDGQDNCSRYRLRELSKHIKETEAIIYAFSIAEVQGGDCGQLCQMYSRRALDEMTEVTGGKAFFPTNLEELEQAASQIALELRQQYSLGYIPMNSNQDSKWRKISVQVRPDSPQRAQRIFVRTKAGYFAHP